MKEQLIPLGIAIIFVGFTILVIGTLLQTQKSSKTDSKFFAGGVVGFVPFGFGSDRATIITGLVITALLFLFWLILGRYII